MENTFVIDFFDERMIHGWAFDQRNPNKIQKFELLSNKESLSFTAEEYRKDLQKANKGDGYCAFNITAPSSFNLIEHGFKILNEEKSIIFEHTPLKAAVHLEVTDLIVFLNVHGHVSGIQRLQLEVIGYVLENYNQVGFVCFHDNKFKQLPTSYVKKIYEGYTVNQKGLQDTANFISNKISSLSEVAVINKLLITGAPWSQPSFFEAVFSLKNTYKTSVYQILYDLIPHRHPEYCTPELSNAFSSSMRMSLACTDKFIAISEYSRIDLELFAKELGYDLFSSTSIPLPCSPTQKYELNASTKISHLSGKKFVLFVSTVEARKNHALLFDIWKDLKKESYDELPILIWAGRLGWRVDDLISQLNSVNWVDNKIEHISDLADSDIDWLYRNCLFTVFPSKSEGWGLPVSESLYRGKVCISSNSESIPEAADGLLPLIDYRNYDGWKREIVKLVSDDEYRAQLEFSIKSGYKKRGWDSYAKELLSLPLSDSGETKLNTQYRNIAMDKIFYLTKEMLLPCRNNIAEYGNPLALLSANEWYELEENHFWAKGTSTSIHINRPLNHKKCSMALKLIFPEKTKEEIKINYSLNGIAQNKSLRVPVGSNFIWIIINIDFYNKDQTTLVIHGTFPKRQKFGNEARSIYFGLGAIGLIDSPIENSSTKLLAVLNNIIV